MANIMITLQTAIIGCVLFFIMGGTAMLAWCMLSLSARCERREVSPPSQESLDLSRNDGPARRMWLVQS